MGLHPLDDVNIPFISYWHESAPPLQDIPAFGGHLHADVVVVGAGFTGLSAALFLAEKGIDVVVVDANEPGWGASGRNNGQVVAALKHEPHEIEQRFGQERGSRLIQAIGNAPQLVFDLIEKYQMQCPFNRRGIITAAHSLPKLDALKRRNEAWAKRGVELQWLDHQQLAQRVGSDYYFGGTFDPRGGALNPLAYSRELAHAVLKNRGRIYKHAHVSAVRKEGSQWLAVLENGSVRADRVIIATNGYTDDLWPGLKRTVLPARTPQLVSEPLPEEIRQRILPGGETLSDTKARILGIRIHPDGRIHFGGGGASPGPDREQPYANIRRQSQAIFPFLGKLRWAYRWSGFVALTPDRYPRLFELAPGVTSVLGYSGRGLGAGTLMGQELAAWASGAAAIDDLALPLSRYQELPYYPLKNLAIDLALGYYAWQDKKSLAQHPRHKK